MAASAFTCFGGSGLLGAALAWGNSGGMSVLDAAMTEAWPAP